MVVNDAPTALTSEEEGALREFYEARTVTRVAMGPSVSIPRLLATLDRERETHRRWVDVTYGRDGSDSVLLYKSTHRKLESAWYALANVAQWDEWAQQKLTELQAAE